MREAIAIPVSDNLDVKISKEPYTSFMQMLRIYKTISKDMWTIFNKNRSKSLFNAA